MENHDNVSAVPSRITPSLGTRRSLFGRLGVLVAGALGGTVVARESQAANASEGDRVKKLEDELKQMANRLGILEDTQAIRKLQHAYGYYMDKGLYEQVVDLFADDGEVVFGNGVFKGKAGQRRLYIDTFRKRFVGGRDGPVRGFLLDHPQLQDIVDIAPDRMTAQGRFRCLMQAGSHESKPDTGSGLPLQWWEGGIYENTYRRDNGVWKIQRLNYHVVFQGNYETGWRYWKPGPDRAMKTFPENPTGPDEVLPNGLKSWPETPIVPYHYAHPVTGKRWTPTA